MSFQVDFLVLWQRSSKWGWRVPIPINAVLFACAQLLLERYESLFSPHRAYLDLWHWLALSLKGQLRIQNQLVLPSKLLDVGLSFPPRKKKANFQRKPQK